MEYSEFIGYVVESFKKLMGNDYKIELKRIIKNNDYEMDALVILEGEAGVSPTIYLDYYFQEYKRGKPVGEIITDIYKAYNEHRIRGDIGPDYFSDFSKIKDSIAFKLVNRSTNKKFLGDIPYFEYLDLAIVFYFIINTNTIKNATALIRDKHLEIWDITKEELLEWAACNTPKLLKYNIASINDVIKEIISDESEDINTESENLEHMGQLDTNMFVLTNQIKTNGAACILYEDLIKRIAMSVGKDIYIIPSSVHEVIIVPDEDINKDELNVMVRQVNSEEVEGYEILADHVYKYVLNRDEIMII